MSDATTAEDHNDLHTTVSKNAIISVLANGLYLFSRLFLPPITLAFVDLDVYGLWAFCFVIIGYFGMSAFGISNAFIRYTGVYYTKGDMDSLSQMISSGLTLTISFSVVTLIGLWFGMPYLIGVFQIAPHLRETAFYLFFGTSAVFMLDLSIGAFAYVLTGMQRIVHERLVWIVGFLLEAAAVIGFLYSGLGIYSLLIGFAGRYVFTTIVYTIMVYKALPGLHLSPTLVRKKFIRDFLHFGGLVQLTGLLAMAQGSVKKVVSGIALSIETVALFDLGEKFPSMATAIPAAVTNAIFPAATHLEQDGRMDDLRALYLTSSRYVGLMMAILTGFMAWFSFAVISAWVGNDPEYALAVFLMSLFSFPHHIHVLTGPIGSLFKGVGEPQKEILFPVSALLLMVLFVGGGYLMYGWSAHMLAYTVALSMVLSALGYLMYGNAHYKVSQWEWLKVVLLPGLIPYLVGAVLYLPGHAWITPHLDNRWQILLRLIPMGVLYVVLCGAVLWLLVFTVAERARFAQQFKQISGDWLGRFKRG